MTMSARLIQTLNEKLGSEGADDMMAWMEERQRSDRLELRELMDLKLDRFDAHMGERLAALRTELGDRMSGMEQRLSARITEQDIRIAEIRAEVKDSFARSLQWNVGLWLSTIAAMGALRFIK